MTPFDNILMRTCMRTTLVIVDVLYKCARKRAALLNVTVSDVVNQALREVLVRPMPVATKFEMVTFVDFAV